MGFYSKQTQLPWLMLPYHDNDDDCRGFYSLSEKKVHNLNLPEAKPDLKRCVGSSYGWLAMVDWNNPSISLLNPLTRSQIQLPPFTTFPDILEFRRDKVGQEYLYRFPYIVVDQDTTMSVRDIPDFYISKIVLSSDPTKGDCIAMAIFGELRHLAFCRVDETKNVYSWIPLQHYRESQTTYSDVVYWRDQFYAVNHSGGLVYCDLTSTEVKVVFERPAVKIDPCAYKYLAVDPVSGELLMILRQKETWSGENDEDSIFYRTTKFEIYRLEEEKKEWDKAVKGIGKNKVLFLGCNSSMCLCIEEEEEEESSVKGNCVYFTDDYWEGQTEGKYGGHDLGIFNIEEGTVETLSSTSSNSDPNSASLIWPPPVWTTPSLPSN